MKVFYSSEFPAQDLVNIIDTPLSDVLRILYKSGLKLPIIVGLPPSDCIVLRRGVALCKLRIPSCGFHSCPFQGAGFHSVDCFILPVSLAMDPFW